MLTHDYATLIHALHRLKFGQDAHRREVLDRAIAVIRQIHRESRLKRPEPDYATDALT